jgi:hypothetical protein
MARPVLYQIIDRPNGRFDVKATLAPDKTFTREGLASLAEVNMALDMLRDIMAACGAELVLDPASVTIDTQAVA